VSPVVFFLPPAYASCYATGVCAAQVLLRVVRDTPAFRASYSAAPDYRLRQAMREKEGARGQMGLLRKGMRRALRITLNMRKTVAYVGM